MAPEWHLSSHLPGWAPRGCQLPPVYLRPCGHTACRCRCPEFAQNRALLPHLLSTRFSAVLIKTPHFTQNGMLTFVCAIPWTESTLPGLKLNQLRESRITVPFCFLQKWQQTISLPPTLYLIRKSKRLSSASNSVLSLKLSPMMDVFHICYHTVATSHKWL